TPAQGASKKSFSWSEQHNSPPRTGHEKLFPNPRSGRGHSGRSNGRSLPDTRSFCSSAHLMRPHIARARAYRVVMGARGRGLARCSPSVWCLLPSRWLRDKAHVYTGLSNRLEGLPDFSSSTRSATLPNTRVG